MILTLVCPFCSCSKAGPYTWRAALMIMIRHCSCVAAQRLVSSRNAPSQMEVLSNESWQWDDMFLLSQKTSYHKSSSPNPASNDGLAKIQASSTINSHSMISSEKSWNPLSTTHAPLLRYHRPNVARSPPGFCTPWFTAEDSTRKSVNPGWINKDYKIALADAYWLIVLMNDSW